MTVMNTARPAELPRDGDRLRLLGRGLVVAEAGRCIECGLCAWNCPVGVDTRRYARHGLPVTDPSCILCGSCIAHCPRSTLRFELCAEDVPAGEMTHEPARLDARAA